MDYQKLLSSLNKKGIGGKLFKILLSMYEKLKSCIRKNQTFTEFFDCNIGYKTGVLIEPDSFQPFYQ